jgi:prophage regulatory protein
VNTKTKSAQRKTATNAVAAKQPKHDEQVFYGPADLQRLGIPFSRQHLWRLVAEGAFPAPVPLGRPGTLYAKKAWLKSEVLAWLEDRKALRKPSKVA